MGEITILAKATSKSRSLRTTLPISIVKQFGLQQGDKLGWKIEVKSRKLIVVVTPIKIKKVKKNED